MGKVLEFKPMKRVPKPESPITPEMREKDEQAQKELAMYLDRLDSNEAMRTRDGKTDELTFVASDLRLMNLDKIKSFSGTVAEKVIIDILIEDFRRRNPNGSSDVELGINNYVQYTSCGDFIRARSKLVEDGEYTSKETRTLREGIRTRKAEIVGDRIGVERSKIDNLHEYLRTHWKNNDWQEELLERKKLLQKNLKTMGSKGFLESARFVANIDFSDPNGLRHLIHMREKVDALKRLKEAEELYELRAKGGGDPDGVIGDRGVYIEGAAVEGRARRNEVAELNAKAEVEFLQNKLRDYLRSQNIRSTKANVDL